MAVEVFKMGQVARMGMNAVVTSASLNGMALVYKDNVPSAMVIPLDDNGKKNLSQLLDKIESITETTELAYPDVFDDVSIKDYNARSWKDTVEFFEEFNKLFKFVR